MKTSKKWRKKSEITEDELKNLEESTQKLTDKNIAEIDKMVEEKNKEIMSI